MYVRTSKVTTKRTTTTKIPNRGKEIKLGEEPLKSQRIKESRKKKKKRKEKRQNKMAEMSKHISTTTVDVWV